jgi:tetratricopeptide (TPR) repeat protein
MSPHRRTPLAFICFLSLVIVFQLGQSTAQAKDSWVAVQSRNFYLVGNASEKDIRQVATKLEQFRYVFSRLLPGLTLASPTPTTVIVFKSDSNFKPYKPVTDGKVNDVAGYFQSGRDVNYIALSIERESEDTYRTIFHEYVHLLVNNTIGRAGVPAWFNEGLAEYYSTFKIADSRKVSLGIPISEHLYVLRNARMMPLDTVLGVDYYSIHRNKREAVSLFYAQAWAMVHYMIQGNDGKNVENLGRYLDLLMRNTEAKSAFTQSFQMDYVTMEKELKNYIQKSTYRINEATFDRKLEFDAEMKVAALTEAEGAAYLGDLLSHTQRHAEAKTKLEQAIALDPEMPRAHAALGSVLMALNDFQGARKHLAKAAESSSADYLTHYQYAYLLSRDGMGEDRVINSYSPESAKIMRTELRKAIELKPDYAESYHLLALVNLVTQDDYDEGIRLINKAIALAPGNEDYVFVLTQMYLRKNDIAAATKVIQPLTNSGDPRIRTMAQSLLNSVNSYKESLAKYEREKAAYEEAMRNRPPASTAEEKPAGPVNPFRYLEEALRKPEEGEIRVQGLLTKLECSAKGIVYEIKRDTGTLRLTSKDFDDVSIVTFTSDVGGELTCGPRKAEDVVVVTYKSSKDAKSKIDGTLVSIEFVPKDFKLSG